MRQDANNFEKGLRGRAERAEAEQERLEARLAALRQHLDRERAAAILPLSVLDGLMALATFVKQQEKVGHPLIAGLSPMQQRDVRRACRWIEERYQAETNPQNSALHGQDKA